MKKFFIKNLTYLNITAFSILIWWLIFGLNLSYEPYIWDDLSFFRNYNSKAQSITSCFVTRLTRPLTRSVTSAS